MRLSDYKFADVKNKRIDIEKLRMEYPDVAELMMINGITTEFFEVIKKIKNKHSNKEDYSEDVAHFNELLKTLESYTNIVIPGKTSIFPILSAMDNMINRENLGEALNSMNFFQYDGVMREIRRNVRDAEEVKYRELSDEDKDLYHMIRGALIAACSAPEYSLPETELKVEIGENGIKINNSLLNVDYNAAQAQRRELLKEFNVDDVLKELGMTNPIQRMLAKRKIDPAVLLAIKETDFKGPTLELLKKSIGGSYLSNIKTDELREKTVKQYVSTVLGKEIETDGKTSFSVEYDVREVNNSTMKKYARRAKDTKKIYVQGDTRSPLEVLRDKIFGEKIKEAEVVENSSFNREKDEKKENPNAGKIVDTFVLEFGKAKAITDGTPDKVVDVVNLDEQNGGGEEK